MKWYSPLHWWCCLLLLWALPGSAQNPEYRSLKDSVKLHGPMSDMARYRLLCFIGNDLALQQPRLALPYKLRALPLIRRIGDTSQEMILLDHLAVYYARMGNLPQALSYYLKELHRAEELGNLLQQGNALLGISNIQADEKNYADAEATARRGLAIARRIHDELQEARFQLKISGLMTDLKRYREAEIAARAALPTLERIGDKVIYDQADAQLALAEALCGLRQYGPALAAGGEAIALMNQLGDAYGLAWAYGILCRAALGQGDTQAARRYGRMAIQQARLAVEPGTEEQLLGDLVEAYQAGGDLADALAMQQRLTHLRDSLFDKTRAEEMARMQTQFDTETKRREIKELRQQARIQTLEGERERARVRWLTGGLVAVVAALLGFVVLSRRLQQSREALRRANQTKDQLISILGHDLRGPVAAFQQVGSMVRHYARNPNAHEQVELANELEKGATQLAGVLDNMLHWARTQMGQVVNHPQQLEPNQLVGALLVLYGPAAVNKHLTLRDDIDAAATTVWADPDLLNTVLRNLLANAIKFTPEKGTVTIAVQPTTDGRVGFSVVDTGVGMTAETVASLFGEVVRPTSGTAGEKGTGLGLAVSRQFVRLLGGELLVQSVPGEGTRFWFELPVQA